MSATDAFATLTRPDAAADERVAAVDDLKRALSQALEGRRVTEGSVVLERAHRLRQRLDSLRPHARKGRLDPITDAVADLRPSYEAFLQEAQALPVETAPTQNRAGTPALFRNVLTVARKEVVLTLQGTQGVVLFLLLLLTFGVGLEAVLGSGVPGAAPSVELAWRYAHSLDFLSVPLVGILLGYHLLNEERQLGTIHFLGSKPVTRGGIVLGKWLGMAAVLGVLVSASALIVGGVAWSASGALGDALVVVGFPVATFLLALAFASIAFVIDRKSVV